jgi:HK97 family phage prohead protease
MSEHTKALTGVEIKDAAKGTVEAVFATLDVVDHDGDITLKGAFQDGAPVRISAYGHKTWDGALPVGRGTIRAGDTDAVLEGKFFLNSQPGRDTFETVKEMADLQEWSYGFDIVESEDGDHEGQKVRYLKKLKVHEVSPVLLGAGVGTRTLAVKDAQAFTQTLLTNMGLGLDAGVTPFSKQAEYILGDVGLLLARAKAFGSHGTETERKEGRALSTANRERLQAIHASLAEMGTTLEEFLAETDPAKTQIDALRELARHEFLRAGLTP